MDDTVAENKPVEEAAEETITEEVAETKQESVQEELIQMDFRVVCTREQLLGLRQYLIDHQIKYGKAE